jgi:GntR family transcriptional regulator/MocR family aminotransferase
VIAWARGRGAVVLEDDYDGEFRYDRQPIGALQGLAPDVVAYAGSASKTLAPGLRLGWLVVPTQLVDAVAEEKAMTDRHSDTLSQLTLAAMIESGAYDRHVRAARLRYRRRRDELVATLGDYRTSGIAAGLQVVLELPGYDEHTVLRTLAERDVVTFGMSRFGAELPPAVVLGCAHNRTWLERHASSDDSGGYRIIVRLARPECASGRLRSCESNAYVTRPGFGPDNVDMRSFDQPP